MFPGFFKTARMFGRGDFRYVVLDALNKKPMHGYEIMKVIGNNESNWCTKHEHSFFVFS